MIKALNHVGIAVSNLDESIALYERMLGVKALSIEDVPALNVKVALFKVGEVEFELIQPTTPDGAVARFIESRGQGVHHICFEVDNIDEVIAELRAKGVTVSDKVRHQAGITVLHTLRVPLVK